MDPNQDTAANSSTDFEQRAREFRECWKRRSPQVQRVIDALAVGDVVTDMTDLTRVCREVGIPYYQGYYVFENYPELIRYRRWKLTSQSP